MSSLTRDKRHVNAGDLFASVLQESHQWLLRLIGLRMTLLLNRAVDELLARERYQRRGHVTPHIEGGACQRCHSRQSRNFSRNAGRKRRPLTWLGPIQIRWPRVKCQCGGSVQLNLTGWLEPYQRLSAEVDRLIQRWAALSLSLRQMQRELTHTYIGPLALRTLTARLHQLQELSPEPETLRPPPVLQVDGIYVSQLRPNGQVRQDAKGRKRAVKGRCKRCILIALGVWPDSGRQEVIAWQLADGEGFSAWLSFLSQLEAQGLLGGPLSLIIHDGAAGLGAALHFLDLGVPQQRCLFHKLKNIAQDIQAPEDLSAQARRHKRRSILRAFQAIWQAKTYPTLLRRYLQVWRQYRHTQPKAVATLRRDFRATLTYFQVQAAHPTWQRRFLRTTARLERFNRSLRRRFRSAGAYHSDQGLLAVIAQTADEAFQPGTSPSSAKRHTFSTT
jgi:transposase-like protein